MDPTAQARLEAASPEALLALLRAALALRRAEVTERNPISSRSHAVCELRLLAPAPLAATPPPAPLEAAEGGAPDEALRQMTIDGGDRLAPSGARPLKVPRGLGFDHAAAGADG